MRARAPSRDDARRWRDLSGFGLGRPTIAALVFLRGRDADGRLRQLEAARAALRPVLGALAGAFVERRACEALGYRAVGDWSRERLGVGARTVREWARVWSALEALPKLREAVLAGEVGWSVARRVVSIATPESDAACLETVRGRSLRAVEALLAAVKAEVPAETTEEEGDRVRVSLPCSSRVAGMWAAAVELARRTSGDALPLWGCAEQIAAEGASVVGATDVGGEALQAARAPIAPRPQPQCEHGLRDRAWPGLRWKACPRWLPAEVGALAENLEDCSPRELDSRLRAAIAFLQSVDFELGRILRQMVDRRLHRELGFESFGRYVTERLDTSPRTARRLVALARAEHRAPAVATAFRTARLTAFQAHALVRVRADESAVRWARRVTLRRLEDDLEAQPVTRIEFWAPRGVASLFLAMVARAGSLERLLAHVIVTWVRQGERFRDYADFARDGYRCTVPGCTARRNLESHHVIFRSRGGPDAAWNRTTLCHHHHHRGVHASRRRILVLGMAPDRLEYVFEALGERFRSGDVHLSRVLPEKPMVIRA
jgi:hypothetical protein